MTDVIQREIEGLAICVVPSSEEALRLRSAGWFNLVHSLGLHVPLPILHDIGQLWSLRRSQDSEPISPPAGFGGAFAKLLFEYARMANAIAESDVVRRCQTWRLSENIIAVMLTKTLAPVFNEWVYENKTSLTQFNLPLESQRYSGHSASLGGADLEYFSSFLRVMLRSELRVRHAIEQLDIDTLRLLGLFKGGGDAQNPLEIVDLLGLFTMPMVNDIVNFSLQIIPSVLESSKLKDAQISSMDGFEGIERNGHLDNLMLSEFVYDEDVFFQRYLDNEMFFYSRSRIREEERKVHYVMLDASASMRGRRTVFARGVALAMIKKLMLQGERPILRFFDSQLYAPVEVTKDFSVPYLLSFRSERGRNYKNVFTQLLGDLRRLRESGPQSVMLYVLTHGQCHLPVELVARLREVAYLFGIYILPSEPFELEYLSLLHKSRLIQADALNSQSTRRKAAIDILSEIG
ncbi:MAG: hypothetical protein AUK47_00560 [Deltaproteobacteria bacterium CG2_30_63_29]|nr:MAG: hypothetical protein AUK47_00560 [Deltaproteobacteria bacterium CG2_30_63_29]PJB41803.1 MAG: hypothetical protein CO108_12625 [Deltaproteobacteria bacterium CG_4_9_14_3_um_filter_63_12]